MSTHILTSNLLLESLSQTPGQHGVITVSYFSRGPIPPTKYSQPIGKITSGHLNIPNQCVGVREKKADLGLPVISNTPLQEEYEAVPISFNTVVKNGITYLEGNFPEGGHHNLGATCDFMTSSDFLIEIDSNFRAYNATLDSQNSLLYGRIYTQESSFPTVPSIAITGQNPSRSLKISIDHMTPVRSFGINVNSMIAIGHMDNTSTPKPSIHPCTLTITSNSNPVPQIRSINVWIGSTALSWELDHDFNEDDIQSNGNLLLECPIKNATRLLGNVSPMANVWMRRPNEPIVRIQSSIRFDQTAALLESDSYYVGSMLTWIALLASAFAYFF